MAHTNDKYDSNTEYPTPGDHDDLERQLLAGLSLTDLSSNEEIIAEAATQEPDQEGLPLQADSDIQGALGLFAEASQDMATAGLELSLGRHFACVDYCNQVAEKAAQAVSLVRFGHRSTYDHDLQALGLQVSAPAEILQQLEQLTPFHPEAFYADTPPEIADEVINAEQASKHMTEARNILRWARGIVLTA